jgi:hypothetical protein
MLAFCYLSNFLVCRGFGVAGDICFLNQRLYQSNADGKIEKPTHIETVYCDQLRDSWLIEDLSLSCEFVKSGQCPFLQIWQIKRFHCEILILWIMGDKCGYSYGA